MTAASRSLDLGPTTPARDSVEADFDALLSETSVPCRGGDAWTSESAAERVAAAAACRSCRLLTVCGDVADRRREPWGVWGGVDRVGLGRARRAS